MQVFSQFIALTAASIYHSTYSHFFLYSISSVIFMLKAAVADLHTVCRLLVCIETPIPTTTNNIIFPGFT